MSVLFFLSELYNCRLFNFSAANEWQHVAKLSFIENQIKICESIGSSVELEHWYSILGTHLALHGTESRVRILLDDLLGQTHNTVKLSTAAANASSTSVGVILAPNII